MPAPGPLGQIADIANLALALSILAITIARQIGSPRPAYTRSWVFFGLAAGTLVAHSMLDLAGASMEPASRLADLATTALLSVAFVFLYGADREGLRRIQEAAERDGLTGLYNLQLFTGLGTERLERTLEKGGHCAVAIFDLDEFKDLNDSLGHQAGDRMLQVTASAIRANVRPHDITARYGGDEFILLMDRCEADDAHRICVRILRSVVLLSLAAGKQITLSCGIAIAPENGTDLRDLIAYADKRLLTVKRTGKNAVLAASPA